MGYVRTYINGKNVFYEIFYMKFATSYIYPSDMLFILFVVLKAKNL